MTIRVARYLADGDEWDEFVRAQPGWTHFHLFGWRNVVERALGHECIYLEARDPAGVLVGILPLVRVRSRLFGHYLVSMPFLNYGGPLGTDAGVQALVSEAEALAREGHVTLLELRSRVPLNIPLQASHRKVTVVLNLPAQTGSLFKQFDSKLR